MSGFLRKETLGIIYHNHNIISKTVIGSNPGVIHVSKWHMIARWVSVERIGLNMSSYVYQQIAKTGKTLHQKKTQNIIKTDLSVGV